MKVLGFLGAGVMALLLFSACGGKQEAKKVDPTVRVSEAVLADEDGVLQYPGRVVSSSDANLSFRVPGQLKRVCVGEGDRVRAGQLIAELDDTDYRIQLSATRAEYAQVKADAERVMALYKDGGTTASNYDKARYGLEQITAKLDNHKNQLAYTKLYAPRNGFIQRKFFDESETVGAGMPVVALLGDGALEVEVNLPAQMYVRRSQLQKFACTLDVLPGEVLPLQLINILPNANSNQLYTMRLRLTDATHKVAPGMSAWVKITAAGLRSNRLVVPETALVHEKGKTFVFVYSRGRVKRAEITVHELHTDGTAIITGSLQAGSQVVSSGVHHIQDGDEVKLLEPLSSTNVGGLL